MLTKTQAYTLDWSWITSNVNINESWLKVTSKSNSIHNNTILQLNKTHIYWGHDFGTTVLKKCLTLDRSLSAKRTFCHMVFRHARITGKKYKNFLKLLNWSADNIKIGNYGCWKKNDSSNFQTVKWHSYNRNAYGYDIKIIY